MNWFERHLNWTVVLATIVANVIFFLTFDWGVAIGCMVGLVIVCGWALDKKGRSLWNILWTLVPYVGMVIFLCLENKSLGEPRIPEIRQINEEQAEKLARIAKRAEQQVGEAKRQTPEEESQEQADRGSNLVSIIVIAIASVIIGGLVGWLVTLHGTSHGMTLC